MSLPRRSQSALEYMMTYGWAILVIVIVAAVLYSLGIFSPSSSLSTTITGFSNLGTVNAVCLGGTSFTISMGDSTGYPINVTKINLTSSSGKTISSPNILIQPNSIQTVTVPSSSLCTSGARYSVSAVISYLEPGQIFPGPYTSTGTVSGTAASPPSSATSYEPLTIANTQNQGTPSPFQQMINVTSSSPGWVKISSSPFGQNVEFFSATGQILDSWLENYTSAHAIWWVKLTSSIPAGSKQTIYMGFAPTSTNLFNTNDIGEVPQLSPTYAEYDDGANVFNNYWNFAGTSLPSGWTYYNSIPTINNGLDFASSDELIETTSAGYPITNILEADVSYPTGLGANMGFGYVLNSSGGAYTFYNMWVELGADYYSGITENFGSANNFMTVNSGSNTQFGSTGQGILSVVSTGSIAYGYSNYITYSATSNVAPIGNYYIAIGSGAASGLKVQWLRVRAYPPNGVMPSVSFGSVS
ncbi:MAG: DUF2341 domain-containing protein [Candidatus Parvarchaeota archaeon]|nr:DUF2341 domain-containing protein [Candidatus Parvarchaeota archaeon]